MAIVLRFSDFRANTYLEHEKVRARGRGGVWWGWWKKQHEPFPGQSIDQLRGQLRRGEVEIGLVNRVGVYLSASCDKIDAGRGGDRSTPDVNRTPRYYRSAACPLWLHLTKIESLSEEEWIRRFGPVPVGDDTFFHDNAGELEVVEESVEDGVGYGLLHLSDLHFGGDYAFAHNGDQVAFSSQPFERRIAAALPNQPAGVIVSGDLTTRGDHNGLISARMFLERLAGVLSLPRDRVVVAPGNHDILVDRPDVTLDFSNEQDFRTQMMEFYGKRTDLERIHQFTGEDGITYFIVTLNSSRPRDRKTMNYGYVGRDRSQPILAEAAELRDACAGPTWLGLVLHHHILPGQQIEYAARDEPASLTLDGGEIVAMTADLGFDAIMHGHEHLPFVGKASRIAEFGGYRRRQIGLDRPVLVLGAGSASVRRDRLTDEMRYNSFSYYEIESDVVNVQLYEFTEVVDPVLSPEWDFQVLRERA